MNVAILEDGIISNVIVVKDGSNPLDFGGVALPEGKWIGDRIEEQPDKPTMEERVTTLEADKADKTELNALTAAIEKGLRL